MTIDMVQVRRAAVVLAASTLCAWPAYAQQPSMGGRAALVQKLADCRKVADDSARLACFDAAEGGVVVVHDFAGSQWRRPKRFSGFNAWVRQALDDCIEFGGIGDENAWRSCPSCEAPRRS